MVAEELKRELQGSLPIDNAVAHALGPGVGVLEVTTAADLLVEPLAGAAVEDPVKPMLVGAAVEDPVKPMLVGAAIEEPVEPMLVAAAVDDPIEPMGFEEQVRLIKVRNSVGQLAQPAVWFRILNASAQAGEAEKVEHTLITVATGAHMLTSLRSIDVLQFGAVEDSTAEQLPLHKSIQEFISNERQVIGTEAIAEVHGVGQDAFIEVRNGAGQLAQAAVPLSEAKSLNAAAHDGEAENCEHTLPIFTKAAQRSTSPGTCDMLQFGDSEDSEAGQLLLQSCRKAAGPSPTAIANDLQFS